MFKKRLIPWLIFIAVISFSPCAWAKQGVPVIIYHELVESPKEKALGETVITIDQFKNQMEYLAKEGFTTLSMEELVEFMKGQRQVPKKSIVITFDDGWRSQLKALPILERLNFKASFWIITGDGYGDIYINADELKRINANPNWEVESHTVTHPWNPKSSLLTWLKGRPKGKTKEDVWRELIDSKAKLEQILGHPVTMLAWPCGWYNRTLIHMAQDAGYTTLLTIIPKMNVKGGDILQIRRFFIDGRYSPYDFKMLVEKGNLPSIYFQP